MTIHDSAAVRRVWHGWTTSENADRYEDLLTTTIIPGIWAREIEGLQALDLWRRLETPGGLVEFVTVMSFVGWDPVVTFAGGDGRSSVVPEAARQLLHDFDTHSQHYEVRTS